jgi:hypothetical protein
MNYYDRHSSYVGPHYPGDGAFDPTPDSPIRTLFIHGFPANVLDREIYNLLRTTCHGFDSKGFTENLHILRKPADQGTQHPVTVFAKFADRPCAYEAIMRLNNFVFDQQQQDILKVYFAKSDLNSKNSSKRSSDDMSMGRRTEYPISHPPPRFNDPRYENRDFHQGALGGIREKRVRYEPTEAPQSRPGNPCKTLFVGFSACTQFELEDFFSSLIGFNRITIGKHSAAGSYAFAEFESIDTASAVLRTCDKHPVGNGIIRLSFAKKDAL